MRGRFGLAAAAVALLATSLGPSHLLLSGVASASSQIRLIPAAAPAATGPDARDLNFRKSFGLSQDVATIDRLKSAPGTSSVGSLNFDVALSAAEQQEMTFRVQTLQPAERTPEINAYLQANAATFGGMYLDHQAGGKVTFLFTSDIATRQAELQRIFTRPDRLVVRQVAHTDAELNAVKDRLSGDFAYLATLGLESAGVDTPDNAVNIAGPGADAASLAELQARYGDPGVPVLLQPSGHFEPQGGAGIPNPPFVGGQDITPWHNNFTPICTLGFVVKQGAQYYATTAGHCAPTGTGYTHQQPGTPPVSNQTPGYYVGTVRVNNLTNPPFNDCPAGIAPGTTCGHADAEILDIGRGGASNLNLAFQNQYDRIHAVQGWDADRPGDLQCLSGWVSHFNCGNEVDHNRDIWGEGGNLLRYQRTVNFQGQYGDSGGSVVAPTATFYDLQAVGTWGGSVQYTSLGFFSQIWDMQNQLNVSVVTSDGPY